jgi:hypothetical protein
MVLLRMFVEKSHCQLGCWIQSKRKVGGAPAAMSNGIASACRRGDWSYGSLDRIPIESRQDIGW